MASRPPQQNQRPVSDYGKIDISNLDTQLWLSRLPENLAICWDKAPTGTRLGTLTFTKGTPAPKKGKKMKPLPAGQKPIQQRLTIQVDEQFLKVEGEKEEDPEEDDTSDKKDNIGAAKIQEIVKDLPLDYTVTNLTTKIPTLHPFTRNTDGKVVVHGTVNRSCNLQIEQTKRYRDMCDARMKQAEEKRFLKTMDEQTEMSLLTGMNKAPGGIATAGFGSSIASFGKKLNEAKHDTTDKKRKWSDTQSVRSILFDLFEQQSHWAVKELRRTIGGGRSEATIRTELQQIAEYQKTGEFKGHWELKAEFKAGVTNK